MKRFRNWLAVGIAALSFSTIAMADDCGYVAGFQHPNGGGFVALTAYVEPSVWVSPMAYVCGINYVYGNAVLNGYTKLDGFATISGNVTVTNSYVSEFARIESNGNATPGVVLNGGGFKGHSVILDQVAITGPISVDGHAHISGQSTITSSGGPINIGGNARLTNVTFTGTVSAYGRIVLNNVTASGDASFCNDETLNFKIIPSGNAYCHGWWKFSSISSNSGAQHICFIGNPSGTYNHGSLFCLGDNTFGQISPSYATQTNYNLPYLVTTNDQVTYVATGAKHTCSILAGSGQIQCWGKNDYGQIGNGTISEYANAIVPGITNAYKIALGQSHTCALAYVGGIQKTFCWGRNNHGQLGIGSLQDQSAPIEVISTFTNISSRADMTCGVNGDSSFANAKCWGLVAGVDTLNPTFVPSIGNFGNHPLKQIITGLDSACVYDSTFQLICWGKNESGQFGNGTSSGTTYQQPTLSHFSQGDSSTIIHSSGNATCAQTKNSGRLFCWGNYPGNSQSSSYEPEEIFVNNPINLLGSAFGHFSLTTSIDTIFYWGSSLVNGQPFSMTPTLLHDSL